MLNPKTIYLVNIYCFILHVQIFKYDMDQKQDYSVAPKKNVYNCF